MVKAIQFWAVGFFLAVVLPAGQVRGEDVVALQDLVRQWIELRGEIAEAERTWAEQEAAWNQEIALLKEERARLQASLEADAKKREADLTDRTELGARRNELKAILARFPKIPGDEEEGTASVSSRLQLLLANDAEQDDLHHSIQVSRRVVDIGAGMRKQVEVLSLGLSRAFAVSETGDWAAVGIPAKEGWDWSPRPELAGAVRRAIRIQSHEEPAALIGLPLQAIEVDE